MNAVDNQCQKYKDNLSQQTIKMHNLDPRFKVLKLEKNMTKIAGKNC